MELNYRLKQVVEPVGELVLRIECLENLNETIDQIFDILQKGGRPELLEELCPYFGVVWPSARALAREIHARQGAFHGRKILEVGCGLALPSLLLAKLGNAVLATDFHPEVARFLERNIMLNEVPGRLEYRQCDWQKLDPGPEGGFDWVIGSDILYESQHAPSVARALARNLAPDGTVLLADPARPYLQPFADEMKKLGFVQEMKVMTVPDEPKAKDIFLLTFRR